MTQPMATGKVLPDFEPRLNFGLDHVRTNAKSFQSVVYPGVLRSCLMLQTRSFPARPALASNTDPRPYRLFTESSICIKPGDSFLLATKQR
jgi:hypothetical protein